jgi:putative ABC transport system permease protein
MKHAFFLALRYLLANRLATLVLILASSVALFLPLMTYVSSDLLSAKLRERGLSTPVLIGHKGNEFDLTMNSLYFRGKIQDPITMEVYDEVLAKDYGLSVPLYVSHTASRSPIVGTNIDYFSAREMKLEAGRYFAVLGEVVAGAAVAKEFNLKLGDKIRSDMQNLYNIAGAYPMILEVVGILKPRNGQDDRAFFADVNTVWSLDGIFHGHEDVTKQNSLNPNADTEENLEATAAIFMFSEITDKTRTGFHLHGDSSDLPLSSVAVFPPTQEKHDMLFGEYALSEKYQAVRPVKVVESILEIVLRIQQGLSIYFITIILSTMAFFVLVLVLSLQLRQEELQLMRRIGGSKSTIRSMIIAQVSIIWSASAFLAVLGTGVVWRILIQFL